MIEQLITFVNPSVPAQKIVVCDSGSAKTLERLLSEMNPGAWVREESEVLVMKATDDRRKDERRAKEFRVILISGTSTYRCATCDVSTGGMKLKTSVPASFCTKECQAYISHADMRENIEVTCKVTTDASGLSRLEFVKPKKPEMAKLSEWMAEQAV